MKVSTGLSRSGKSAARLRIAVFAALSFLASPLSGSTAFAARAPDGAAEAPQRGVAGLSRVDGYVPFYFDGAHGRVLMEIPVFDQDVLYYVSAATNPGSVEAPFDRGIVFSSVIHFERSGGKVVVNQINLGYRATEGSAKTQEGVADSFPTSVLAVLPVESEAGGKVIVDATSLFMRDAGNIAASFRRAKLGDFKFDPARSVFYPKRMKAFPENTEIETISTFTSDAPGAAINNVTPSGYTPRVADPRIGVSAIRFQDFSKPVDDNPYTQWVTRWRLERKDPNAA